MIRLGYTRAFTKQYNGLEADLRSEIQEKLKLFRETKNHRQLKVHKLHGDLADYYAFSVNYDIRIVFYYVSKQKAICTAIGTHDKAY